MARALLPNSTQIPDVILDFWLSELSGAELKVVFYIARRTYGFGKESDNISLTQICSGITKRDGTVLDTGTGLSRSSVARAVKTLEEQGIILRKLNLSETSNEHEESTYSLNLNWQPNRGSGGGSRESDERGGEEVVPKSNHPVSKGDSRWSQNRTTPSPKMKPGVVPKSNPQETDQETVQETAATEAPPISLLEELVKRGINRVDAVRLMQTKPEECERQIEFLAYMPPRKDEARWLVSAIQGEYGPPKSYRAEKAKEASGKEHEERERAKAKLEMARLSHQEAHEGAYLDYLASRLVEVQSQPQAFMAFREAETKTREFYAKTLPGRLAEFDEKRVYLLRFAEFFASRKEAKVLSFWDWDSQENRTPLNANDRSLFHAWNISSGEETLS
jgi:phage replication O-like protein O